MLYFLLLFFYLVTWWEQSQPLFPILRLGLTTGTGSSELSYLIKKKEVSNIRNHCLLAACFIIELRKLDFWHLWIYWIWECATTGGILLLLNNNTLIYIGTRGRRCSRMLFMQSTGYDISGHYFLSCFSSLSTFLEKRVLESKNLYCESWREHRKT